jgi:ATP-binding cassette subfamily F protein uup
LETEQQSLHDTMASPGFYQQEKSEITKSTKRLEAIEQELAEAFARWELLESLSE